MRYIPVICFRYFGDSLRLFLLDLPRRHGNEKPFAPFDYLEISYDETIINGYRNKGLEFLVAIFPWENSYFCNLHRTPHCPGRNS